MRNHFAETLYAKGVEDSRIHVVVADISPAGSMGKFREEFPERFINTGVAEQSMIGICAGLALKGMRPFAYTIATFSLYRPFEMVRNDLCYQNLPVTVVGIGGGVIYSTLGGTHYAQEDVAIAASIPNMTVIAPSDPLETVAATEYCATESQGPVYLRLGKAGEPVLTEGAVDPWRFGKLRRIQTGEDVLILSYGVTMRHASQVAERLRDAGRSVSLVAASTLKPFDREGAAALIKAHKHVIVIEEMVPRGGLASEIKQLAWDIGATARIDIHTLKDEFVHCYGSHDDILAAHGIDVEKIVAQAAA